MTWRQAAGFLPRGLLFPEGSLGNAVKSRGMLIQIGLPPRFIPEFQMIADSEENHVMLQARELSEPFGNQDSTIAVDVRFFRVGEEEASEYPTLCIRGWRLIQPLTQFIQLRSRISPQALVRARRNVELVRVSKLLANSLRQYQAILIVESPWVSASQQHGQESRSGCRCAGFLATTTQAGIRPIYHLLPQLPTSYHSQYNEPKRGIKSALKFEG
jgi:hypothetical protein